MNEKLIIELVKPYIENNSISFEAVETLFSNVVNDKELSEIIDFLIKKGITLEEAEDYDDADIVINNELLKDSEDYVPDDIKKSKYYHDLNNENLCELIQNGEIWAKNYLCIKNSGLVHKYARAYKKYLNHKLDYEDLYNVGLEGLLVAAEKYTKKYNTLFSTYAVFWIRQRIRREIYNNGFSVRMPVYVYERINKINTAEKNILAGNPTIKGTKLYEKIAKSLGSGFTPEEVSKYIGYRNTYINTASLDIPIGDDKESTLGELIEDDSITPDEYYHFESLKESIKIVLSSLTQKEQEILEYRFGLKNGEPMTLESTGKIFNVTRERIRQIEQKALQRLSKNPEVIKTLKEFYNKRED